MKTKYINKIPDKIPVKTMAEKTKIGIHIFRRDLRIEDNTNLRELAEKVDIIIPVFILTRKQILDNKLRNDNFVQFLLESLEDLDRKLGGKLVILDDFDSTEEEVKKSDVLVKLVEKFSVAHLSFMQDYTLYSRLRDKKIADLLGEKVEIIHLEDSMLCPISEKIRTDAGNVYQKFTPYYNKILSSPHFNNLKERLIFSANTEKIQSKIDKIGEITEITDKDKFPTMSENQSKIDKNSEITDKIKFLTISENQGKIDKIGEITEITDKNKFLTISENQGKIDKIGKITEITDKDKFPTMSENQSKIDKITEITEITDKNKFLTIREKIQKNIDFSPITSENRKKGGRTEALKILRDIEEKKFSKYDVERDYPAKSKTTKLSAYLKLGSVSIREVAKIVLQTNNYPLFRELIWRDFYYSISYHFSHVLLPLSAENSKGKRNFDKSEPNWKNIEDPEVLANLEKWKTGQTGFPIVDAGMRQLNSIGWMHNRLRMIVASFLIKNLGIDWQEGEKYFAQKLIDYDPSQNNGGWQWVNGSGVDSQPYNRIFNPWEQAKKWDPEAEYIKLWVPELSFYPTEIIHNWGKVHGEIIRKKKEEGKKYYFAPIVDHATSRQEYLNSYH